MADSDYEYDVFFSYKKDPLITDWIANVVSRLEFWLTQELGGRPARIFIDRSHIEIGDRWPDALRHALRHSRTMAAIWSPSYFHSQWCVSEWRSFLARETLVGLDTHGLIAPAKFYDGEHFPEEAKAVQQADFRDFSSTVSSFWQCNRAEEFERTSLKSFAVSLAGVVNRAPVFQPDWPIVEAAGLQYPSSPLKRLL
jgi:hypothetical protein